MAAVNMQCSRANFAQNRVVSSSLVQGAANTSHLEVQILSVFTRHLMQVIFQFSTPDRIYLDLHPEPLLFAPLDMTAL